MDDDDSMKEEQEMIEGPNGKRIHLTSPSRGLTGRDRNWN